MAVHSLLKRELDILFIESFGYFGIRVWQVKKIPYKSDFQCCDGKPQYLRAWCTDASCITKLLHFTFKIRSLILNLRTCTIVIHTVLLKGS